MRYTIDELIKELEKLSNKDREIRLIFGEEGEGQVDSQIYCIEDDDSIVYLVGDWGE